MAYSDIIKKRIKQDRENLKKKPKYNVVSPRGKTQAEPYTTREAFETWKQGTSFHQHHIGNYHKLENSKPKRKK